MVASLVSETGPIRDMRIVVMVGVMVTIVGFHCWLIDMFRIIVEMSEDAWGRRDCQSNKTSFTEYQAVLVDVEVEHA